MKQLFYLVLLAFTLGVFLPETNAQTANIPGTPVAKAHKKKKKHHRRHHRHHHHRHHHHQVNIIE